MPADLISFHSTMMANKFASNFSLTNLASHSVTTHTYATTVSRVMQQPVVVLQVKSPLSASNFELYLMSHLDCKW